MRIASVSLKLSLKSIRFIRNCKCANRGIVSEARDKRERREQRKSERHANRNEGVWDIGRRCEGVN